ncbi:DUF2889 domain-containing protein [Nitrincola alkalisediminis]|uniref:DUF2889 domain-containing protein n=1 Tax=Nitrincola alkalisediminis TaxID=1366656 RepID=UPI001875A19E|nr:DUF2889 domain-containing protein [Nitrincola alkalisediminis]
MPLSKPVKRRLSHRRTIVCEGYERDDGLWDIEGRMVDVKSDNVENQERGGYVAAGEPFHDIRMRLTIDQSFLIHQVEASMDATPFQMCPGIVGHYKRLEGTRIGRGWHKQAQELTGGVEGCTHLNELLKPLTTTAVQTLWPKASESQAKTGAKGMLNTCHTWAEFSPAIAKYQPHLFVPHQQLTETQDQ